MMCEADSVNDIVTVGEERRGEERRGDRASAVEGSMRQQPCNKDPHQPG